MPYYSLPSWREVVVDRVLQFGRPCGGPRGHCELKHVVVHSIRHIGGTWQSQSNSHRCRSHVIDWLTLTDSCRRLDMRTACDVFETWDIQCMPHRRYMGPWLVCCVLRSISRVCWVGTQAGRLCGSRLGETTEQQRCSSGQYLREMRIPCPACINYHLKQQTCGLSSFRCQCW